MIPSVVFKALEEVVPHEIQADSGGAPMWGINGVGQFEDGLHLAAYNPSTEVKEADAPADELGECFETVSQCFQTGRFCSNRGSAWSSRLQVAADGVTPSRRDPDLIKQDLMRGLISAEAAARHHV